VREVGPVRKRVPRGAERYLPLGRVLLGLLKARLGPHVPTGVWNRTLADGTAISVSTRYGQDTITIRPIASDVLEAAGNELLLESGFITFRLGSTAAGKTYYTDALAAEYASGDWLDYYDPEEDIWWSEVVDGEKILSYTAGRNSLAVPAGHSKFGFVFGNTPNGLNYGTQTGKAKLLFQCAVGSDQPAGAVSYLIHGPNTADVSYALFTTSALEYFVLRITRGGIAAAPLQFTNFGEIVLEELRALSSARISRTSDTDSVRRSAEAYVLSEANAVGGWDDIRTFPAVTGTPVVYGWAANWDGTELHMVTHQQVFSVGSLQYIEAVLHKLSVEYSGGSWIITYSQVEVENWAPEIGWVFRPKVDNGVLVSKVWYPLSCGQFFGGGYASPPTSWDVPVYCWYSDSDKLVVRRHFTEPTQTMSQSEIIDAWGDIYQAMETCGFDEDTAEYEAFASWEEFGFYDESEDGRYSDTSKGNMTVKNGETRYYYYRHIEVTYAYTTGIGCHYIAGFKGAGNCQGYEITNKYGCSDGYTRSLVDWGDYLITNISQSDTGHQASRTSKSFCVIPAHSSDGAYIYTWSVVGNPDDGVRETVATAGGTEYARLQVYNTSDEAVTGWLDQRYYWIGSDFNLTFTPLTDQTITWDTHQDLDGLFSHACGVHVVDDQWFVGTMLEIGDYQALMQTSPCGSGDNPGVFAEGGPLAAQISVGVGGSSDAGRPQYIARGSLNPTDTYTDPVVSDNAGDVEASMLRGGVWAGKG
jgi:hypothetical protein